GSGTYFGETGVAAAGRPNAGTARTRFRSGGRTVDPRRYAPGLLERPAVKRGRMVNRTYSEPSSQLHERPRQLALMVVSIGLVSLLLATIEFRQNIRAFGVESEHNQRSLAVMVAALVSIL